MWGRVNAGPSGTTVAQIAIGWNCCYYLRVNFLRFLLGALSIFSSMAAVAPFALHPENSHYFLFRGQPTIVITSGEHYGAVLNVDFDYNQYLSELQARGLNGTRTFSGVYYEPMGAFNISENTLAPAPGRYIGPWSRTTTLGAKAGGSKFDLKKWNEAYFARLRDFMSSASAHGVIVELNLFCPFYEEAQWNLSPMNPLNNVNNLGDFGRTNVYTMDKNGGLLQIQETLVRRIVVELNQYDNLYYEICNEPYFGGVTLDWQSHIADVILDTESRLPNRHLISQNIANGSALANNVNPGVSIFNFHYASPPNAVAVNYSMNRVIGDNETGFRGTADFPYRREAWEFILAGGGLFNNLDYSFTVRQPAGTYVNYPPNQPGGGNPGLREQYRTLKNFITKFDFLRMQPDPEMLVGGVPAGMSGVAFSDTNRNFAVYLSRSAPTVNPDKYSVRWTGKLRAPKTGEYTFYTISNDGVRLSVDAKGIIDNWSAHSETEDKGTIVLQAGKLYDFRLEYYQAGGNAVVRLGWKPPGGQRAFIPTGSFLSSSRTFGLDGEYFLGQNFETLAFRRIDPVINFDWSAQSPFDAPKPGGVQAATLKVNIGAGEFLARWIYPRTGAVARTEHFRHDNGPHTLTTPPFEEDIALDLRKLPPPTGGKRLIEVGP